MGRYKTWLSAEQNAEMRRIIKDEGINRRRAWYRVLTPEQRRRCISRVTSRCAINPKQWMLDQSRRKAKSRNIEWNLTVNDLHWPTKCPVTDIDLVYPPHSTKSDLAAGRVASLDRIDNKTGYVPGNVIIVSQWVNVRKGDATPEQLRRIADFYNNTRLSAI